MDKILTIIVPTYNMEKYLRRCLDSLIIDEEGLKLLEVLVINDGSKDSSSKIAHEYQDKYPDTFRVIDKENGNYGSCINRGLKEATGKYIKILDADDYYDTLNLSLFIERLIVTDVDAVLSCHSVYKDMKKIQTVSFKEYHDSQIIYVEKELPSYFTMDNITYKRNVFNGLNYHQTEGISYTDQEWIFYPMVNVKTLCYFDLDIYQYMTGHEGQTMEMTTYYGRISQVETIVIRMLEYLIKTKEFNRLKREYLDGIVKGQTNVIYRVELLINNNFNKDTLLTIDELWRQYNITTFKEFDKSLINKYFPVHFVKKWHCNGIRYGNIKRQFFLASADKIEKLRRLTIRFVGLE